MSYFFGHVLPCIPGYYLDYLPLLFADQRTPPLVKRAAMAVAYSYISHERSRSDLKFQAMKEYTNTVHVVQSVITKPRIIHSDGLLMIILLFLVWEVRSPTKLPRKVVDS